MSIKTTGAEFKEWINSDWGDDSWWDDYEVLVNGVETEDYDTDTMTDADKIEIRSGVIIQKNGDMTDAKKHFKAWQKKQTHIYISVCVSKEKETELRAFLATIGAKA